jgi:DNA topoisomerase-1
MNSGSSHPSPRLLARRVRLRYFCDTAPGFRRQATRRGFRYLNTKGKPLRSPRHLERIARLAIPPAWTDVWICPLPSGHIQATGRDAKGRKQYRYHEAWQELSNRTKFDKLCEFGERLPEIRRQVTRHLAQPGLTREKVIAAVIALLDRTLIRVGNDEYARENDSYGLTTMRHKHVRVKGADVRFRFQGKSGKLHEVDLHDRRLAKIVRQCQDLPGQELFKYRNGGDEYGRVCSNDVNAFLQAATGNAFTAKDFRTWKATALVWVELQQQLDAALTEQEAKRLVAQAIRNAAAALGNTITVCRKYYVHPQIAELFVSGKLLALHVPSSRTKRRRMTPGEQSLLRLLRRLQKQRHRS